MLDCDTPFRRWAGQPDRWPTGTVCLRFFAGELQSGTADEYQYASAATVVPILWQNGDTTWHHISELRHPNRIAPNSTEPAPSNP